MGINTTFDKNNNEFTFQYSGPGKDIILFYFKLDNNYIEYEIECPNGSSGTSSSGSSEYSEAIFQVEKKELVQLHLNQKKK